MCKKEKKNNYHPSFTIKDSKTDLVPQTQVFVGHERNLLVLSTGGQGQIHVKHAQTDSRKSHEVKHFAPCLPSYENEKLSTHKQPARTGVVVSKDQRIVVWVIIQSYQEIITIYLTLPSWDPPACPFAPDSATMDVEIRREITRETIDAILVLVQKSLAMNKDSVSQVKIKVRIEEKKSIIKLSLYLK